MEASKEGGAVIGCVIPTLIIISEANTPSRIRGTSSITAWALLCFWGAFFLYVATFRAGEQVISHNQVSPLNFTIHGISPGKKVTQETRSVIANVDPPIDTQTFPRSSRSVLAANDERIIGGTPAPAGKYPYYVVPAGMILCGGTLIYPEYVPLRSPFVIE